MHRRQLLHWLLASSVFTLPLGVSAAQIQHARLWRTGKTSRLVLDLSGPVQYKTFSLTAPERLIIDVSGASLRGDFSELVLANTGLRAIRFGHFGQGITRIVLDLDEPVQLSSFLLPPKDGQGHRLVLDLTKSAVPQLNAAVATPSQVHPKRDIIVVIDPGHGGKDPGATSAKVIAKKMLCCLSPSCWPSGSSVRKALMRDWCAMMIFLYPCASG